MNSGWSAELEPALRAFAAKDRVLVACDFDGTLSEIVERPMDARPVEGAVAAVESLAERSGVTVLLVSGRGLRELRQLSGPPRGAELVGGHGSEFSEGLSDVAEAAEIDESLKERVETALGRIASEAEGLEVEVKATGVALHYRRASAEAGAAAAERARCEVGPLDGVHMREGKAVVEFSLAESSKGGALSLVRESLGVDATLFVGDDVTDEEGFAVLGEGDVTIKVGEGATRAQHRVSGPSEVVAILEMLDGLRSA